MYYFPPKPVHSIQVCEWVMYMIVDGRVTSRTDPLLLPFISIVTTITS